MEKNVKLINAIEDFVLLAKAERVLGPYNNGNSDRQIVIIINDDGSRRTVSYPKYLLEKHLGRKLDPNLETCDHWDRDHNNNDISNLRIVPRDQHSADDTRRVKLIDLECDQCHNKFQRSPRLMRDKNKKGVAGKFCTRSCAAKYSRAVQLGKAKPLPVQPFVESEYYRNIKNLAPSTDAHVATLAHHFLQKYASSLDI